MYTEQLKIQQSLVQHLLPNPCLIDSRTETDYLHVLTDFARLINFYDRSNIKNGNWSPFLLKDPVILMATIAKTSFQNTFSFFINTYSQLQKTLLNNSDSTFVTNGFNQLFDQLFLVFHAIERWTYFIQKSTYTYNLKTYIIDEVKQVYSALLWAILELKSQLRLHQIIIGLTEIDPDAFDNLEDTIWTTSKGKTPYWTLLGLQNTPNGTKICKSEDFNINCVSLIDISEALEQAGKKIFNFFNTCISYAKIEFETVKEFKAEFPDTLLIRTFIDLLKIYKDQINTISEKHLEFYYQSILKQQKQTAIADKAFICCDLAKKTATYTLPKSTLFSAGKDADGNPIVFESVHKVSLNPAQLSKAYTLTKINNNNEVLYLTETPSPNVITKDENGTIEKWKTFGSQYNPEGDMVTMGFSFASPMLYCTQATTTRTLTLQFVFTEQISASLDAILKNNTSYFLSTADNWFQPSDVVVTCNGATLTVVLTLEVSDPAIANFTKNPDGYESSWPLFKMLFSEYDALASPPQIQSLQIQTEVIGLQEFELYNNYGLLSTKKPFQLFGPTPNIDDNFIIGSTELFSKPLQNLTINIDWSGFDDNFSFETYYDAYNQFLNGDYTINNTQNNNSSFLKFLKPSSRSAESTAATPSSPFNYTNTVFEVNFQLLQNGVWKTVELDSSATNVLFDTTDVTVDSDTTVNVVVSNRSFNTDTINTNQTHIDPNIQNTALQFSDSSSSGFIKMQLIQPNAGFGLQLYPKVINAAALYNANFIINSSTIASQALPANQPYTPLVKTFACNYTAETNYVFDGSKNNYPLECFYYAPFQNYKIYDTTNGVAVENTTIASVATNTNALPLFPSFNAQGQLLIALQNVIAPSELSLYIELTSDNNPPETAIELSYYYLSSTGWKTLPILADTTNHIFCSGIITFNIPEDISQSHTTISGSDFWISIATQNQPDAFAQTTFLKANGFKVARVLSDVQTSVTPYIDANSITGSQTKIPELSATTQPFPSFGGKASETVFHRNKRISTRLKTKGRLITSQDYFNTIRLQFSEIYFSKTIYNPKTKTTLTYVVKKVDAATDANAFLPLVSTCYILNIQNYIKAHVSAFVNTEVSNFEIGYLKITADIQISNNSEPSGIAKTINNGINLFLSPWILSEQEQITINEGLSTAQLATFITSYDEVVGLNHISLQLGTKDVTTGAIIYGDAQQDIYPTTASVLLVPSLNNLTDNSTITYTT